MITALDESRRLTTWVLLVYDLKPIVIDAFESHLPQFYLFIYLSRHPQKIKDLIRRRCSFVNGSETLQLNKYTKQNGSHDRDFKLVAINSFAFESHLPHLHFNFDELIPPLM